MRTKRVLAVLLLIVVATGMLAGCTAQQASTGTGTVHPNIKAIQAKKKIVIGTSSGYFPFEMVNKDGKLIGFDIDLGEKIGDALGVTVEWKDMSEFASLIPALEQGQLDLVIAGMTIKASRALSVDYTIPYFRTGQALLVNKNVKNVSSWEDLDKPGNVIAVASGTTGNIAAERLFKNATLRVFDGSTTAGLEVLAGNAQGMVYDLDWISIYASDNPDKTYAILEPFTVENMGIAVRPGQMDLLYWLNTFLTEFVGNEDYEAMYGYYFRDMPWKQDMPQ